MKPIFSRDVDKAWNSRSLNGDSQWHADWQAMAASCTGMEKYKSLSLQPASWAGIDLVHFPERRRQFLPLHKGASTCPGTTLSRDKIFFLSGTPG